MAAIKGSPKSPECSALSQHSGPAVVQRTDEGLNATVGLFFAQADRGQRSFNRGKHNVAILHPGMVSLQIDRSWCHGIRMHGAARGPAHRMIVDHFDPI